MFESEYDRVVREKQQAIDLFLFATVFKKALGEVQLKRFWEETKSSLEQQGVSDGDFRFRLFEGVMAAVSTDLIKRSMTLLRDAGYFESYDSGEEWKK